MKYEVRSVYLKHQKIVLENDVNKGCLCKVEVNDRLYKLIYLEPLSTIELLYHEKETIKKLFVSIIKEL